MYSENYTYVPLALILAAVISHVEYMVISPEHSIPDLSFINILGLLIVMVFFVGFIEELVFRSVLANKTGRVLLECFLWIVAHEHIIWGDAFRVHEPG
ncbi:MAG: hypothetical protein R2741_15500 [Methanolobus sp.]